MLFALAALRSATNVRHSFLTIKRGWWRAEATIALGTFLTSSCWEWQIPSPKLLDQTLAEEKVADDALTTLAYNH